MYWGGRGRVLEWYCTTGKRLCARSVYESLWSHSSACATTAFIAIKKVINCIRKGDESMLPSIRTPGACL